MQVRSHGESSTPSSPSVPAAGRERLDGDVGDAEENSGRGAEHHAVVLVVVELLRQHEEGAERQQRRLEGDHRREWSSSSARRGWQRHGQEHEAERGEADARPLARADRVAEPALRQHGEEHEPAGDYRLDDRERRHGERGHVEDPRDQRHQHADARTTSSGRGRRRCRRGASCLRQEPRMRRDASAGSRRSWRRRRTEQEEFRLKQGDLRERSGDEKDQRCSLPHR